MTYESEEVPTGTLDLDKGGTYTMALFDVVTLTIIVPVPDCGFPITDCTDLNGLGFDCKGDVTKTCECSASIPVNESQSGTWSQKGTAITFVPADKKSEPLSGDFCADDKSLEINSLNERFLGVFKLSRL